MVSTCGGLVDQVQSGTFFDPRVSPTDGMGLPTCTGVPTELAGSNPARQVPIPGESCPGVLAANAEACPDDENDACTCPFCLCGGRMSMSVNRSMRI